MLILNHLYLALHITSITNQAFLLFFRNMCRIQLHAEQYIPLLDLYTNNISVFLEGIKQIHQLPPGASPQLFCARRNCAVLSGFRGDVDYSHSIVAGGLDVIS